MPSLVGSEMCIRDRSYRERNCHEHNPDHYRSPDPVLRSWRRLLRIFPLRYGRRNWHTRRSPDRRLGAVLIWPWARIGTIAAHAFPAAGVTNHDLADHDRSGLSCCKLTPRGQSGRTVLLALSE